MGSRSLIAETGHPRYKTTRHLPGGGAYVAVVLKQPNHGHESSSAAAPLLGAPTTALVPPTPPIVTFLVKNVSVSPSQTSV